MTGREQQPTNVKTYKNGVYWFWAHPTCPFNPGDAARYSYPYETQPEAYAGALAHMRVHGWK